MSTTSLQQQVCALNKVAWVPTFPDHKIGIAKNVRLGVLPVNGVRLPAQDDTNGWYIWAGESMSEADDFFSPLHAAHLAQWCPEIQKFLGLPPGWRFLKANDYEDVWFDPAVLEME